MSSGTLLFLLLRALHVLLAALWIGAVAFIVIFVFPALRDTGAAGGPLMTSISRRGLSAFMGALGGTTALTGFYLYWRMTGHFDPALSATVSAMVFGTGGILGTVAVVLDGAVVGRSVKKMGALGGQAIALPEGPERARLMRETDAARNRALAGARIVLALQAIALVCMAVGHYV